MTVTAMIDPEVLEHVAAEVDSIKAVSDVKDVAYEPHAWTREGAVD